MKRYIRHALVLLSIRSAHHVSLKGPEPHEKLTFEISIVRLLRLLGAAAVQAQDWPQWRGPNRDNKVVGFVEPKAWPKELKQKWKVTVGEGDASPVLVADKLYLLTRQGGEEVVRCVDAATGKDVWINKYATPPATGAGGGVHAGPRSTPAVADGKVCTFGVSGVLCCFDAASGKELWRKDTNAHPRFFISFSPIIVDGRCIVYIGGNSNGEIVAYDLATGAEKWKWTGADGPSYGSPALMDVAGTKQIVTLTGANFIVSVGTVDGKELWKMPFKASYNSGTPIVDGDTVICSGPNAGTVAFKVEKVGEAFKAKELWKQTKSPAGIYNTPVLKDGLLFGFSSSSARTAPTNLYCMDAKTGDVLWTDAARRGACGTVLDAGPVLLGLSDDTNLIAFKPSKTAFSELAKIKVASSPVWAYPIVSGNRLFVKDRDSLTLWTFE